MLWKLQGSNLRTANDRECDYVKDTRVDVISVRDIDLTVEPLLE
jgi:hypothetical protein